MKDLRPPEHIPEKLVVDFNYLEPGGENDAVFTAYKQLHKKPDIFWTPQNHGHWVVTRGDYIRDVLLNHKSFSSYYVSVPHRERTRCYPTEADPPEHRDYRQITNRFFSKSSVEAAIEDARQQAKELIAGFYSKGHCEFVSEFAQKIPLRVFLKMCGLVPEEHPFFFDYYEPGGLFRFMSGVEKYFLELIRERRENFRDDFIGAMLAADFSGRKLTDRECAQLAVGIILGALDTVTSSLTWSMLFLARHETHRRQLSENPGLIPNAVNEFIRRFSVSNTARIVVEDMDFKGVFLKAGDPVFLPTCLHGMDERSFTQALEVDFHRKEAGQHSAFSQGIHSCPGRGLATGELGVFLEEWLKYIPDFRINGPVSSGVKGIIHFCHQLPLQWNPQGDA